MTYHYCVISEHEHLIEGYKSLAIARGWDGRFYTYETLTNLRIIIGCTEELITVLKLVGISVHKCTEYEIHDMQQELKELCKTTNII